LFSFGVSVTQLLVILTWQSDNFRLASVRFRKSAVKIVGKLLRVVIQVTGTISF